MKTILIIPAIDDHINVIKLARNRGCRVITCDNVPTNAGHQYADISYDIDLLDYGSLITMARTESVDAVWGYSTDIGTLAAAKVSDALDLGGNAFDVINIMCDKSLFRTFLTINNFNCPRFVEVTDCSDLTTIELNFPLIVKPVDRAGSKGVTVVGAIEDYAVAVEFAMNFSLDKRVIVEEFIIGSGPQLHGDILVQDGKIAVYGIGDQFFDQNNCFAPISTVFPSSYSADVHDKLRNELDRFVSCSGFLNGAINVEARYSETGDVYFIELGPRCGGNYIPNLLSQALNYDIIDAYATIMLGLPLVLSVSDRGVQPVFQLILRAPSSGILSNLEIDISVSEKIIESYLCKSFGDFISTTAGADNVVGVFLLRASNYSEMLSVLDNIPSLFRFEIS